MLCSQCRSKVVYFYFNFKTPLVAILVTVQYVLTIYSALDTNLLVYGYVHELNGHQRLQIVWVQELAIVRIILEREASSNAKVCHLPKQIIFFFFLQRFKKLQDEIFNPFPYWPNPSS